MKYGILSYSHRPMRSGSKNLLNIGDPIQSYAMKYLYSLMGIEEQELVPISRYKAKDYRGENVVLPFNAFNMIYNQFGHPYSTLPVSTDIMPIFISFHLHSRHFDESILDNLRAHQPIGCRDEETMINMRKHGINAYMTGCVTALLPKRVAIPKRKKTFFVDIPKSLMGHIPPSLLENAEFVEHQVPFERISDGEFMSDLEYQKFNQMGISQLSKYRDEATLVVTSRLHAAAPCMAMGIPVILTSDNFDGRFSWLDKFIPLYTPELYDQINWNPSHVDYEVEKKRITDIIIRQIREKYQQMIDIKFLNTFYGERKKNTYNKGYLDEINNIPYGSADNVRYAIWGLIAQSQALINAIDDNCPGWRLEAIIDKAANGDFEGIKVQKPSIIEKLSRDIIYFVLPEVAHEDAKALLTKLGIRFVLVSKYRMEYYE